MIAAVGPVDLVLSSGFLAFAAHAGFVAAVEDAVGAGALAVDGVCGTSSGALVGALWASGMPAAEILAMLTARAPLGWASPSFAPWRGLLRLDRVIAELRTRLPATIEALPRPFGVGVATRGGGHRLVTSGPLPEAVAASCAVPWLFAPVQVADEVLHDGGVVDRTALAAWRAHRPAATPVVHLVERSAGAAGEPDLTEARVVRSPRSGARLWSVGPVDAMFARSRAAAAAILARGAAA